MNVTVALAGPKETSWERPREWIGSTRPDGSRWASYADQEPNPSTGGLIDGLYVEVTQTTPATRPLVWASATRLDRKRDQFNLARRYDTWEDALRAADEWRRDSEQFLTSPLLLINTQEIRDALAKPEAA